MTIAIDGQLGAWLMLLALGAVHGVNPAMGWLFAVGLGLQEGSRRAVWRSLGPLALGHLAAIAAALAAAAAIGLVIPLSILKWIVAALLLGLGLLQLRRHWHPRYGGMRMKGKDLAIWSFLMASAHGAGLMALPFVLGATPDRGGSAGLAAAAGSPGAHATAGHAAHAVQAVRPVDGAHAEHAEMAEMLVAGLPAEQVAGLLATAIHTLGYLLVMGLVAVLVYEKLGLRLLRTAWINLDLLWAGALILTAALTPLL